METGAPRSIAHSMKITYRSRQRKRRIRMEIEGSQITLKDMGGLYTLFVSKMVHYHP
jgi:hypothetical protein